MADDNQEVKEIDDANKTDFTAMENYDECFNCSCSRQVFCDIPEPVAVCQPHTDSDIALHGLNHNSMLADCEHSCFDTESGNTVHTDKRKNFRHSCLPDIVSNSGKNVESFVECYSSTSECCETCLVGDLDDIEVPDHVNQNETTEANLGSSPFTSSTAATWKASVDPGGLSQTSESFSDQILLCQSLVNLSIKDVEVPGNESDLDQHVNGNDSNVPEVVGALEFTCDSPGEILNADDVIISTHVDCVTLDDPSNKPGFKIDASGACLDVNACESAEDHVITDSSRDDEGVSGVGLDCKASELYVSANSSDSTSNEAFLTTAFTINLSSSNSIVENSLQDAFKKLLRHKQKELKKAKKQKEIPDEARKRALSDPNRMWKLRMKFLAQAKKYFGVPYAKKYWTPEDEEFNSPIFLDCCGLVRRVLRDLKREFGFRVGPGNQSYLFDTLPVTIEREEDMKPGDLVFISAIYNNPKSKKQKHNLTHVEIWLGDGPKTIGARWQKGKVQMFDSYMFNATSYHSPTYIFKSIDTWLMGICRSHCSEHTWRLRSETFVPSKKSVFAVKPDQQQQRQLNEQITEAASDDDDADLTVDERLINEEIVSKLCQIVSTDSTQ